MTTRFLFLITIPIAMFSSCKKPTSTLEIELNKNWTFRQADKETWMPAEVPGCVHTDLFANKVIEDPFYRLNEHQQQWIDKADWEYQTTFKAGPDILEKTNVELDFKGLDTYADVYLNDQLILSADNMFREWIVDCSGKVMAGENSLKILFKSPIRIGLEKYDRQGYLIPVSDNDLSELGGVGEKKVSVYTRKAGYHYGWDWGPRFVTSGIWRPVILRAWNDAIIRNVRVEQMELTDQSAELLNHLEIYSSGETVVMATCLLNENEVFTRTVELVQGNNEVVLPVTIDNPKKWWTNGLGEPYLYNLTFRLYQEKDFLSERSVKTGLRTLEVIQEPDGAGKGFYFKLNGIPVFMKGANYIPQDAFLPRVTPERYEHIIQSAADANMNMLRVWGGGIYENDIFYDLCDEKGILIWQDFMYACAMFPGDAAFLENVRQEAIDNIKRLRNHPCLALWCGNNECLSAWYQWGWKEQVEKNQGKEIADKIWKAYEDKFHNILPDAVDKYDDRFYWSSSPCAGMGMPANLSSGDFHYWGVWWGKEPFVNYRTILSRFMSEYGFQSFPELNTIRKFATEEDWDIYSEVMKSHQRSSIGNETIEEYMLRDYKKPIDFLMFLYVGQLVQAEGIKIAMEGHRKAMPYCMGSLFWQIDDCWPVASWSSMDYYGNWKAQHYFAKKAYQDIMISPEINDDMVEVYIVSDKLEKIKGKVKLDLINFSGNVIWQQEQDVEIAPTSSQIIFRINIKEFGNDFKKNECLLNTQLIINVREYSSNILYFVPPKDLTLPEPQIKFEITENQDVYNIRLSTDVLAKNIYLSVDGIDGFFSDNYFDLLPGAEMVISFQPKGKIDFNELRNKVKVITLVDSY